MTNATISNSLSSDLSRTITWQFDKATHFVGIINLLKDFASQSTEQFFDGIADKLDIADSSNTDLFGITFWGKLFGIPRIVYNRGTAESPDWTPISTALYRKLVVGRIRLAMSNGSPSAYETFCNYVFGSGNVTFSDNQDMSISFTADNNASNEIKWIVANRPEQVFAYPAGVRTTAQSTGPVLGFAEQANVSGVTTYVDLTIKNTSTTTAATIGSSATCTISDRSSESRIFVNNSGEKTISASSSETLQFKMLGKCFTSAATGLSISSGGSTVGNIEVTSTSSYVKRDTTGFSESVYSSVVLKVTNSSSSSVDVTASSKFSSGGNDYSPIESVTIAAGESADVRVRISGNVYTKPYSSWTVKIDGTTTVANVTAENSLRSCVDFEIGLLDGCTIAWNRKFIDTTEEEESE